MSNVSGAKIGFGVQFEFGDGESPEGFTKVAEVTNVSGAPSFQRGSVRVTHTDSPDRWHEEIAGLTEGSTVTITMNFLPGHASQDGDTGIFSHSKDPNNRNYRVRWPMFDPEIVFQFLGHLESYDADTPIDDRMTATATFKIAAAPFLGPLVT